MSGEDVGGGDESVASEATDDVTAKLTKLGVDEDVITKIKDELGVTSVDDLAEVQVEDLVGVGMKLIPARKLVGSMTPAVSTVDMTGGTDLSGMLPAVPNYTSLLEMLKTGGVLRIEASTLIAAVQASIASRAGLFTVPEKLAEAMLQYSKDNEEPVDQTYYRLKKQLTRRTYGDLFSAIDGFDGRSVSDKGKKELFIGIDTHVWPAVIEFFQALDGWMEAWTKSSSNPAMLMNALTAMAGGRGAVGPAIGQAPETGGLRDQADKFNDAANRAFAGEGIQIAAAVAYDATEIRNTLTDPRLPSLVGAANSEQMLKQLGISVSAADPRFEADVTKFVMSIMQVKNLAGGNDELMYFNALYMLGAQINWTQLGGGGYEVSGVAGRTRL